MNIIRPFEVILRDLKVSVIRKILAYRIQYYNPTLKTDPAAIWNYGYKDMDSIQLGKNVVVMPYAEIVVFKHSPYSSKFGKLNIGNNSVITTGVNLRAAGGIIQIGEGTAIGEYSVLVSANHTMFKNKPHIHSMWDESKTDIIIGDNVWVGAGSILVPGCRIGDNSVLGAGSVLNSEVPENEFWAGIPAKKIKDLPESPDY